MLARSILFVLACTATTAAADSYTAHANVGAEVLGGPDAFSAGVRLHGGIGYSFGDRGIQPTIAVGGTLGSSYLSVSDRRALDGSVNLGLLELGPEVTVALRFANGGFADSRVFLSAAWLYTELDDRLMLDAIDGVEGTQGARVGAGVNWMDRLLRFERAERKTEVIVFFAPHQFEVVWERSAGSDRFGAVLSWGL